MNRKADISGTLLLILVVVTFFVVMISASIINSELQIISNLMYSHLIEMLILLVAAVSLPFIVYYTVEKKNKLFDFLLVADAITITVIVVLFIFPYTYAIYSGDVLHMVSAKLSVDIEVPTTIFGLPLSLTPYSFNSVTLDGYFPNTVSGSIPISFGLLNGNNIYTEVDAYCSSTGTPGTYKLTSSGEVLSTFPSFTFAYAHVVNVTVPNIPEGDSCQFEVYIKNSNNQTLSSLFYTDKTQVSLNTPAQTFHTSFEFLGI